MMAEGKRVGCLFGVAIVVVVMGAAYAQDCNKVISSIAPCLGYLQTPGTGMPSPQCCGNVKSLAAMANTSPARRQICNCLKPRIASFPKVTDAALSNLPGKCNAPLSFKISKNINCATL